MRWFRTNLPTNACLAVFALAVQFVLAFGHHHNEDNIYILAAGLGAQGHVAHSYAPPGPATPDDDDGLCAICAAISLAGTLILPTPPVLAQTFPRGRVLPMLAFAAATAGEAQHPFQARAPPA